MSIASGSGSNSVSILADSTYTQGWINVSATRTGCNVAGPATILWTARKVPNMPGLISGDSSITPGSLNHVYSVTQDSGVVYNWIVPSGMSIVSGTNTNSITVNSTTSFVQGWVKVSCNYTSCPVQSYTRSFWVENNVPAQPAPITGPTSLCPGSNATFSTTGIPGVSYNWVVPTGVTIVSGQGLNTINVTISSSFIQGWVSVAAYNPGNSTNQSIATVLWVSKDAPATPSAITGNSYVCQNATGVAYSVTAVPGMIYNWVLPTGLSLASGANTASITVNVSSSFTQGLLSVTASSATCPGSSSNQVSKYIYKNAPSSVGAVTGTTAVCPGTSASYSVANTSGLTYNWTLPSGMSITAGSGTNAITVSATSSYTQGHPE